MLVLLLPALLLLAGCGKPRAKIKVSVNPPTPEANLQPQDLEGEWQMVGVALVDSKENAQTIAEYLANPELHKTGRLTPPYDGYRLRIGGQGLVQGNAISLKEQDLTGNLVYANRNDGKLVLFNLLIQNPPGEASPGYLQIGYRLTAVTREVITGVVDFEAFLQARMGGLPYQGTFSFLLLRVH